MTKSTAGKSNNISDAAVEEATGRTWGEWLKVLDKAGAKGMTHKEIARMLHEKMGTPGWWSQMVTVRYEQARGRREKNQTADGYQIGASKTVNVAVGVLYRAWADPKVLAKWLGAEGKRMVVRKATADKSLRITWVDGKTWVDVNLYGKGLGKSQVGLGHTRIGTRAVAERLRTFWAERLSRLKALLERA